MGSEEGGGIRETNFKNHMDGIKHSNKARKRSKTDSISEDDDMFKASSFAKFHVIASTDETKPLTKLSPFVLGKALFAEIGTLKTVKRMQRGDVLVETDSRIYMEKLQKLSELGGIPVKVSPHRTLNTCKGVVRSREVAECSKEEIVQELESQGVTDAFVISVKDGSSRKRTNTIILSFALPRPPQYIKAGYIRIPVDLYVPNPLRCYKCQKYGHGSRNCRGSAICLKCGSHDHDGNDCNGVIKCPNCSGGHMASSKECPVWVQEKRVQKIKAEQGCTFPEARRLATATTQPVTSSATIVKSNINKTTERRDRNTTKSIETQTDLTWPNGFDRPTLVKSSKQSRDAQCETDECGDVDRSVSSSPPKADKPGDTHSGTRLSGTRNNADNGKQSKGPKIKRPPDPITTKNRFGGLDTEETMESDIEPGKG